MPPSIFVAAVSYGPEEMPVADSTFDAIAGYSFRGWIHLG
jgi:hypothetical protein